MSATFVTQMKAAIAARPAAAVPAAGVSVQNLVAGLLDPITQPLSDLAADKTVLKRTLAGMPPISEPKAFGWDWKVELGASAEFTMDVLDEAEMAQASIAGIAGHHVVRYSARGSLSAAVNGAQDVGAWKFGAKAGAKLDADFEWLMSDISTATLGEAAVRAASEFAAPFSLPRMLTLVNQANFWGASIALDGRLTASLSVAANWSHTGWSWGAEGKAGGKQNIGITLGVEGSASFSLEGGYKLTLSPRQQADKTWALHAAISRTVNRATHLGLELSTGVDFSAIGASAERVARAYLPDPAKLEERAATLLWPGTHLREFLAKEIKQRVNDPNLAELVHLAVGGKDLNSAAEALTARLLAPLQNGLDALAGRLDDATDLASIKARALKELRLDQRADLQPLVDALSVEIDGVLKDARKKFDAQVESLAKAIEAATADGIKKILAPLGRLGKEIDEAVRQVQAQAGKVLDGVKAGLKSYAKVRAEVLAALGDAQKAKFTATFAATVDTSEKRMVVLEALFKPGANPSDATQRLYAAMLAGKLDDIGAIAQAALATGEVADVSGWLFRAYKRLAKQSLDVSFLGLDFTAMSTTLVDFDLKADIVTGTLIAANGLGQATTEVSNRWVERDTAVGVTVRVLDPGTPDMRADFALTAAFSATGKALDKDSVEEMERSIAAAIGRDGPIDLAAAIGVAPDQLRDKRFWKEARFALPFNLSEDEWRGFMACDDDAIFRSVARVGLRVLDDAYRNRDLQPSASLMAHIAETDVTGSDAISRAVSYLARFRVGPSAVLSPSGDFLARVGFDPHAIVVSGNKRTTEHRRLITFHRLAQLAFAMIALRKETADIRSLVRQSQGGSAEALYKDCVAHMKAMVAALEPAAVGTQTYTGLGESVAWPFLAFAGAMSELVRPGGPSGLVPLLTLTDGSAPIALI